MMYHTLPLFVASATATLAQDRLLTSNVVPKPMTPVERCGGSVLQNQEETEMMCRFASKPGFEGFQDWTTSEYSAGWFTDEIKTPSKDWVNCKKVCYSQHEVWAAGLTTCSATVDWLGLKQAAQDDLGVDLKVDQNGLAGDKYENLNSAKEIWKQMQSQFGLSGSNQEIGEGIENQVSGLTDEQLEEKAREHIETAMNNNKKITEWVKTNDMALLSYVLGVSDAWLEAKLGLGASEETWDISEENKEKIGEGLERAKKTIKDKMGGGFAAGFLSGKLDEIKKIIESDNLTNNYIIDQIHLVQTWKTTIEESVISTLC